MSIYGNYHNKPQKPKLKKQEKTEPKSAGRVDLIGREVKEGDWVIYSVLKNKKPELALAQIIAFTPKKARIKEIGFKDTKLLDDNKIIKIQSTEKLERIIKDHE